MGHSVSVIGTIFIDCKGFARQNYHPDGRNLGSIQFVHGGVGRNVAENFANLELPTSFISSLDTSALGKEVLDRLHKSKVDTTYLAESTSHGMGMWLAILDEKGNLAGSISQMPDLVLLENLILQKGEEIVERSSHIILELDLNERLSRNVIQLAAKRKKPIYGIPGNLDVILSHKDLLDPLDCFICNHFEAERLLGTSFTNLNPDKLMDTLIKYVDSIKLRSVVITLGDKGCIYYDSKTKESGYQPVFPVNLVDSSGAGDAFFSGTVMGLIRNLPLGQAVIYGTKVAGWTIESKENTCLELADKIKHDKYFQNLLIK